MSNFIQIHSAFISLLHGNGRNDSHAEVNKYIFQLYFVKGSISKSLIITSPKQIDFIYLSYIQRNFIQLKMCSFVLWDNLMKTEF
jgi:hypothetical protein